MITEDRQKTFSLLRKIKEMNMQLAKKVQLIYAKLYHPIKGRPITFHRFPYLVDIYEDDSIEVAVQKSGQCGISEELVDEAFFLTDNKKLTGLYCFPAQAQLNAFSHARVEQVIKQSEYLSEKSGDTNNVSLREIGGHHIYFRGMQDIKQIISVDADYIMIDEIDAMIQEYIPIVEKRLGGSLHKIKRYISTPTYPDYGINQKFKEGDQRHWYIRCDECGHWQTLDFFKNVDFKREIFICKKCKEPIDNLKNGKWIPTYPGRELHSYHISKLMSCRSSCKELCKAFRNKAAMQQFYNFDLGLPYVVEGGRLTRASLDAITNKSNYEITYNGNETFMGVDIGTDINLIISENDGGIPKILFAGIIKKFEELDRFMKIYNVRICVIDALPETREAKKFAERFPERVYLAYYPNMKMDMYFKKEIRKGIKIVNINRTLSLDYMFNDFFMQKIKLPKNMESVEDFYDHIMAQIRVQEKDRKGNIIIKYVNQGADHYAHARNYCRVAETIFGSSESDVMSGFTTGKRDRAFSGGSRRIMK